MRRLSVLVLLTATLALALPASAYAADRYVAVDGHNLRNTGLQGSPFASVQKGVDACWASGGGTVYVGPGTFTGNVIMRDNVSLRGSGADKTTLKGTGNGSVIALGNLGGGESISGFTITGGVAELGGGIYLFFSSPAITDNVITGNLASVTTPWESGRGGGIYCDAGSPTILNNAIGGNTAGIAGGGIYLSDSAAMISGNTIAGNVSNCTGGDSSSGGGIYASGGSPLIRGNVIADNSATGTDPRGGGIGLWTCPATVVANTITGNTAVGGSSYDGQGGGIYLFGSSGTISGNEIAGNSAVGAYAEGGGICFYSGMSAYAPAISDNTVRGNVAQSSGWGVAWGGGISLLDGAAVLSGNRVTGNIATGDTAQGGGVYTSSFWNPSAPVFVNDVIAGNTVSGSSGASGSAIYCQSSSPRITNTTIADNAYSGGMPARAVEADSFWFPSTPVITNCIVWNNTGGSFTNVSPTYSCFPGVAFGDGNITANPLLTADYLLMGGSPCTDTGSAAAAPVRDILGTPRPQGAGPDMGAHEFVPPLPVLPFAVDDWYAVDEDGTLAVRGRGVLANDSAGYDHVPLSASVAIPPTRGSLALAADGSFTYTPNPGVSGTDTFLYSATDRIGGVDGGWVTIAIADVNDAPVLGAIGDATVDERVPFTFTAGATDEETPAGGLTFSLGAGAPAGAVIDPVTGAFSWTPTEAQGPNQYPITVVVSDGTLLDTETIRVTVAEVSASPVVEPIGPKSVAEGSTLSFTAVATDEDLPPETLRFSLAADAPAGATLDPVTGAFSWTPGETDGPGSFPITLTVSDGFLSGSNTFTATVTEANTPPVLAAIGAKSVDEHATLSFTASATDADLPAQTLTFSLGAGAPAGASIDSATGAFSWTPSEAQGPGAHDITVVASDGTDSDSEVVTVTVGEVNVAPTLDAIGARSVSEGVELAFTATATDADLPANTLTFSLGAGSPAGAVIDAATGAFSWIPTEAQGPGTFDVTISVTDGGFSDSETFTVTVAEAGVIPVIGPIGDVTVDEGALLALTATAIDADLPAQTLTFALGAGAPAGAAIDAATGAFTWTPSEAQGPGTYEIRVVVSDGELMAAEAFTVTVAEVNIAPVLGSIGSKTVNELASLTFTAAATDADLPAQTLTFSLGAGAPAGASITAAGTFTWTPSEAQGPGSYPVTITVSDGTATDSETFTVAVAEVADPAVPVTSPARRTTTTGGTDEADTDEGPAATPALASASAPTTQAPAASSEDDADEGEERGADDTVSAEPPSEEEPADEQSAFPWWIIVLILSLGGSGLLVAMVRRRKREE